MKEQSFTITSSEILDALLTEVQLSVYQPKPEAKAELKSISRSGVWDTGATNSCITQRVVDELGLIPLGREQVYTAGGLTTVDLYIVDVMLPNGILFQGIEVLCVELEDTSDVLIGMDIICRGDFAISNYNNQTTISFRTPSADVIDFGH